MRVRHKIPSIFNLSMVDVVFCTLGCVILLWLWKMEQETSLTRAKQEAETESATKGLLKDMTARLAERDRDLNNLRDELRAKGISIEELRTLLASTEKERDKARKERDDLNKQVADLEKRKLELDKAIAQVMKDLQEKDVDYKASQKRGEELDKQLKVLAMQLAKAEGIAAKLTGAEAEAKKTKEELDKEKLTTKELEERIGKRIKELSELTAKLEKIQKSLEDTQADVKKKDDLLLLTKDKGLDLQKLLDMRIKELDEAAKRYEAMRVEKGKWEAMSKNRFAGVSLTGKHVVFLLDMSGSMELLAEKKASPEKWPEVQATLVNIMKSMPNLEEYQIIGFADNTRFLMGGEGRWLKYDPDKSPAEVTKVLADPKNKPEGGTNMYAAMAAAFALRDKGLDTIYLLSDGIPNIGEGLTDNDKNLSDQQRSEKLGAYVRQQLETRWNKADKDNRRVKINAVGFYYESPDLGAFLWALARDNDGNFVGMSKP